MIFELIERGKIANEYFYTLRKKYAKKGLFCVDLFWKRIYNIIQNNNYDQVKILTAACKKLQGILRG
jgi:hypothetical protein